MDTRVERTQQLFWETQELRRRGAERAAVPRFREMAQLYEARANDLLVANDPDGWIDLYAAITAWAEAGARTDADRLISVGRRLAVKFSSGQCEIQQQLDDLACWLDSLRVVPSLGDFSRPVPEFPVTAA